MLSAIGTVEKLALETSTTPMALWLKGARKMRGVGPPTAVPPWNLAASATPPRGMVESALVAELTTSTASALYGTK